MTANYHLPLTVFTPLDTVQLNYRLGQLDGALNGLANGIFNWVDLTTAPATPAVGDYKMAIVNGTIVFTDSDGNITLNTPADVAIIRDVKASGTQGGTFTAGAWQTRDLTEVTADSGNHVSLAANQLTLAAGTYIALGWVPAYNVNSHQARLHNVDDDVTLLYGSAALANDDSVTPSIFTGEFTLATDTLVEVQHYAETTDADDGYGRACSFGNEIYTVLVLRRQP